MGRVSREGGARGRARQVTFFATLLLIVSAVPVLAAEPSTEVPAEAPAPVEAESVQLPDAEDMREGIETAEREEAERQRWLESPEATRQREESRYAFAELSAAAARELLLSTFSAELEKLNTEPARFLSDAQLVRPLGEDEAAATVKDEGNELLLDASIPVRTEDENGELRKVDLGLEPIAGGFEPVNPLVDVRIPTSATQPVEIGEEGLAVSALGGTGESNAQLLGDKNAFYPEALGPGSDVDRLISPIAGGVEIFDLLRSAESPETLRFHIDMPEGAELRSDGFGGAKIVKGDEGIASVPAPYAVDAQGSVVPVEMEVEGDDLVLHVPHREADVAYPLLVDPIFEDWINPGLSWFSGGGLAALTNGSWKYDETHSWIHGNTYCIYYCWGGSNRGLFVSMPSGTQWEQQYGRWIYSAPNANSYLVNAWANPFVRQDYSNCHRSKYPKPHDYVGMWYQGKWNRVLNNMAADFGSVDIESWGESFILGLSTGNGNTYYSIPCWRDLYVGGVVVWLDDWHYPTIDSISGLPTGKWFSDKTPIAIKIGASDIGLGVSRVTVTNDGNTVVYKDEGFCTGLAASRCPTSRSSEPKATGASFAEGIRGASVNVEDPTGKVAKSPFQVMVDRSSPEITLGGQLANATNEEGSKEPPAEEDKPEQLALSVYNLTIKTTDGNPASQEAKDWRSGVKDIEVSLDGVEQEVPWSAQECSDPKYSCPMNVNYALGLSGIETAGMHTLEITTVDFAGNEHVRHIEFEYFPATGMKDEYVLHYFPLPDGLGNEEAEEHPARPELAVNVMNGNLVYRERDFEVPGAAVDLELERFYNSQLPDSESTEWGEGWTLAETPELDPEEGTTPSEAEMVDSSGALAAEVDLPTEAGKEEFDPELQATITKEADGGYELTDETGESATSVAFSESGRTEALRTEGYAKVDYVYEAGQLSEIEVQDPATFAADPEELEIDSGLIEKPTYASSFGTNGSADGQLQSPADVAVDSVGNLWVADKSNDRIQKFGPDGKFLAKFGTFGAGDGQFFKPVALAIDSQDNIWVADSGNRRVQKFDSSGKFLLEFGSEGTGDGQFPSWGPRGIAIDAQGNAWVSDYSGRIQRFDSSGAFIQAAGSPGSGDGQFGQSAGLDVGGGKIWVADRLNNRVSVFSEAGGWLFSFGLQGTGDGYFKQPDTVEVDREGNVWVGEMGDHRVQLFDSGAKFIAKFGSFGSGPGQFRFAYAFGVETDGKGSLWTADVNDHRIQRWQVPIKAPAYSDSFGSLGAGDGQLKAPADVAVGLGGSLWVVDKSNNRVQKFSPDGKFLAKFGSSGAGEGQFSSPASIAVDRDGNLLVLDKGNNRVQKFDPDGKFLFKFGSFGYGPGQFFQPEGIAADFQGDIWVCDSANARIQRFDEEGKFIEALGSKGAGEGQFGRCTGIDVGPDGKVWAADWTYNRVNVFGPEGKFFFAFGSAGSAPGQFNGPGAIETDSQGNVYVGDRENHRVQQFDAEGKYVRQFGSNGSGPGQFKFAFPLGIETDSKGSLWVADVSNHRIQRWLTAHYAPVEPEPIELSDGDPAVAVDSEGGLIASVEGHAAGGHSYEHEGVALVSHEGPQGETAYEYDGANRLTKVTLANGTWAEIEYDAHGRVKSVEVAPEGSNAKTTYFEYKDTDPRRTTVIPPDDPHLVYDIGADGSVLKWWNKELPPELKLAGTLYDHKEKPEPIWNGDHLLESQAKSKEGIASIQVIANGNQLVSKETCEQDPEEEGVECDGLIIDQWVTSTDSHPPGHLQIEVIATDRIGNSSSERFWIDIPEPPPPSASGSPIPPKFHQILDFREEFGLEIVFPVKNEVERNERIFNLINAWYEGDPVARSTTEEWGVPLRPADIAELEYREWYLAHNGPIISQWGETTASSNYTGYYMDHRAGGKIRVGFISNQADMVEAAKQLAGLLATDRLAPFPSTPAHSLATLQSISLQFDQQVSNPSFPDGPLTVGLDIEANKVIVSTNEIAVFNTFIASIFGGTSAIEAIYEPSLPVPRTVEFDGGMAREKDAKLFAGDFLRQDTIHSGCTLGFGAWTRPTSEDTIAGSKSPLVYYALSAGHCFYPDESVYRGAYEMIKGKATETLIELGKVKRHSYEAAHGGVFTTDAAAVELKKSTTVPRRIFKWNESPKESPIVVNGVADWHPGMTLCLSGASGGSRCGPTKGFAVKILYDEFEYFQWFIQIEKGNVPGDSGGPIWTRGSHKAVGLLSGGRDGAKLTWVTPLRSLEGGSHPPGAKVLPGTAPGILAAPGMAHPTPLHIAEGG